jgi:TRAP-type C4-dicarboxylate transport system permease small subunit
VPPVPSVNSPSASRARRALDALYAVSGALAAVALAGTCVVMLLQVAGRELGLLFRGADDITAWLCAAAAFLALGHTFRKGELVRMTLLLDRLPPSVRWQAEVLSLSIAALVGGYMVYAVTRFVYESWQFNEVAQGMIKVPIWIPQIGFVVGVAIFFVAILDELVVVLRRQKPAYQVAEDDRRARADFSETV